MEQTARASRESGSQEASSWVGSQQECTLQQDTKSVIVSSTDRALGPSSQGHAEGCKAREQDKEGLGAMPSSWQRHRQGPALLGIQLAIQGHFD